MTNSFRVIPKIQTAFTHVFSGHEFYLRQDNFLFFSFSSGKKAFRALRLSKSILESFFKKDFCFVRAEEKLVIFPASEKTLLIDFDFKPKENHSFLLIIVLPNEERRKKDEKNNNRA
jgi:hypothetical protein